MRETVADVGDRFVVYVVCGFTRVRPRWVVLEDLVGL